ncbi:hypothetical protein BDN72DRAFT_860636 [Pluteus cervinus]|uniref:Uncharacterized protein n=1 Tax=Pluteus cervinus TaxID=181527 RepID=A0ACD3AI89_9AGAR|nr:hypothetical protein BDN72DRAFT_860636 [Pluteus cervinus]
MEYARLASSLILGHSTQAPVSPNSTSYASIVTRRANSDYAATPPSPPPSIHDSSNDLATLVLRGQRLTFSYDGTSVSAQDGRVSACGLAALNCARIVFKKFKKGLTEAQLLEDIISEQTVQEIVSICPMWAGTAYPEIEEIAELPIFRYFLKRQGTNWGNATRSGFDKMLERLQGAGTQELECPPQVQAVVITKEPDVVACLRLTIQEKNVFVIFDPHPRPSHPNGSGLVIDANRERILGHLTELMGVDEDLLNDPEVAWQMELFSSEHTFVPNLKPDDPDLESLVLQLSIQSYAQKHNAEKQLRPVREERDKLTAQLEQLRTVAKAQLAEARAYRQGVENNRGQEDIQRSVLVQEIQRLRGEVQEAKNTNDKLSKEMQALKRADIRAE